MASIKPNAKKRIASRAKELAFSPLFADQLLGRGYHFYGETDFNSMIHTERERTERSRRPFVLMLLDIRAFDKNRGRAKSMERIAHALCTCSRKIDTKGWYERNAVFGVLFTELPDTGEEVRKKLSVKVGRALSEALRPDELQKVRISLHAYPEEKDLDGSSRNLFDLYLYPDLSGRNRGRRVSLAVKRIFDILGSIIALMVLSPLLLAIALAVKCSSPGPVLFRQRRMGLEGKPFVFLKFRSMHADNDPKSHIEYIKRYIAGKIEVTATEPADRAGVYKITNDPRVTPLGGFLRKTSLDELPQFFNVLKGEMSLVGPRPPIPYEYESYEVWHRRRILAVKPGLTGLWQVKGRSSTLFDEMVRLDLRYISGWSIWLDLKILLRTPGQVIAGKGAY